MDVNAIPYVVLLGALFGTTLIASRFSVGQFDPTIYIGLRLTLASIGYVLIYMLGVGGRKWPTDRSLWLRASLLGLLGTAVPMTFVVSSLQYQSSGVTAILITTQPALTVILAHFFLSDERLSWRKILGVILALSGATLLTLRGETGLPDVAAANPIGYLLVLIAMFCGSAMTVYARRYMREFDSFQVTSVRLFVAAIAVMPLSLLVLGLDFGRVEVSGFLALGYAALAGTFFGLLLAFYNVKRFGATPAAMTAYVIPVVASVGGVLLLGETVTAGMLFGMALIILGIALINQRPRRIDYPENI